MLSCIVGNKSINTFEYSKSKLKEWSDKGILKCPECEESLIYCHGDFKIPYFKHRVKSDCNGAYSEENTEEHREGIQNLYLWLKNQDEVSNIEIEKYIHNTKQRPDIYFEIGGKRYCIEYQCSPISTQYNKRHELYSLEGIYDIWILGENKFSKFNDKTNEMKLKKIQQEILFNSNNNLIHFNGKEFKVFYKRDMDFCWRKYSWNKDICLKSTFVWDNCKTFNEEFTLNEAINNYFNNTDNDNLLIAMDYITKFKRLGLDGDYGICRKFNGKEISYIMTSGRYHLFYIKDDIVDKCEKELYEETTHLERNNLSLSINRELQNIDSDYSIRSVYYKNYEKISIYFNKANTLLATIDIDCDSYINRDISVITNMVKKKVIELNEESLIEDKVSKIEFINNTLESILGAVKPFYVRGLEKRLSCEQGSDKEFKYITFKIGLDFYDRKHFKVSRNEIISPIERIEYGSLNDFKIKLKIAICNYVRKLRYEDYEV